MRATSTVRVKTVELSGDQVSMTTGTSPQDEIARAFLGYSVAKLNQCYQRIESCVGRFNQQQIWMRSGKHANSAGNLLLHLTGNVRQWIATGVDGAEDVRNREGEFAARDGADGAQLLAVLRISLDEAIGVIESLPTQRLTEQIIVQGHEVTVLEAIYHVVEHFSGHTGQIIFLTKALTGEDLGFYGYLSDGSSVTRTP